MNDHVKIKLEDYAIEILRSGPTRVMINKNEAATPRTALYWYNIRVPDYIFIRDDGWSVGCTKDLIHATYSTWPDRWIGFLKRPNGMPIKIDDIWDEL